jgi:hypothetical protein
MNDTPNYPTPCGFRFGAAEISRTADLPQGGVIIQVIPDHGKPLDVYISRTGRSVRVFRGGAELKSKEPVDA